jgi:hypothetical protein
VVEDKSLNIRIWALEKGPRMRVRVDLVAEPWVLRGLRAKTRDPTSFPSSVAHGPTPLSSPKTGTYHEITDSS